jgi:uncharacterized protein (TIGR02271 family)
MVNTVVGLIDTRSEAEKVVHDLVAEGFNRNNIRVVASGETAPAETEGSGLHGLLVRLGILESHRREIGLPAEHVGYYSEGVRRGGMLVTVSTDEDHMDRAVEILEDHGAVNIEERAAEWQRAGWAAPAGMAETVSASAEPMQPGEEARIPVVEEELKVGKRPVRRGGVRVYSHITEQPVSEAVTLREEHVNVERHPVDRPLTGTDTEAFKESSIEFAETGEEIVAAKEARVVEEVIVSKDVTEHTETVTDTVRRTDVEVEALGAAGTGKISAFEDYDADFRQHYQTHLSSLGEPYDRLSPAYRYGYLLGTDPAYANQDWPSLESDARRRWEESNTGTWEKVKNAIHYAWERAHGRRGMS